MTYSIIIFKILYTNWIWVVVTSNVWFGRRWCSLHVKLNITSHFPSHNIEFNTSIYWNPSCIKRTTSYILLSLQIHAVFKLFPYYQNTVPSFLAMASLHFCNNWSELHQTRSKFPTLTTSKPYITNIPILSKIKAFNLRNLRLQILPQKHSYITDECVQTHFSCSRQESPLKIGILDLGSYGQFLAMVSQKQGHTILAASRSDYSDYCHKNGILFFR